MAWLLAGPAEFVHSVFGKGSETGGLPVLVGQLTRRPNHEKDQEANRDAQKQQQRQCNTNGKE
jgi:hypothetical protein